MMQTVKRTHVKRFRSSVSSRSEIKVTRPKSSLDLTNSLLGVGAKMSYVTNECRLCTSICESFRGKLLDDATEHRPRMKSTMR